MLLAALFGSLVDPAFAGELLTESGPVETASVALHLLAAGVALAMWRRHGGVAGALAVAEVLMALREMDAHRAFTTYGVFSTKLYARAHVPLMEKILAAIAVLALAVLVAAAFWASRREIRDLHRRRAAAFYGLATLPVVIVALKEIDGLPRMLAKAGVMLSERADAISHSVEELGEMTLPLLTMMLLVQLARAARPAIEARRAAKVAGQAGERTALLHPGA
jgi:hypothetical protein